jgi:hypothetical protein
VFKQIDDPRCSFIAIAFCCSGLPEVCMSELTMPLKGRGEEGVFWRGLMIHGRHPNIRNNIILLNRICTTPNRCWTQTVKTDRSQSLVVTLMFNSSAGRLIQFQRHSLSRPSSPTFKPPYNFLSYALPKLCSDAKLCTGTMIHDHTHTHTHTHTQTHSLYAM